ncbi:MAG: hypothetical protein IH965_09720 [Gemmatimonadetes bacterium]|nr:hypothetical protein [Gemmatimonadota bacterium]
MKLRTQTFALLALTFTPASAARLDAQVPQYRLTQPDAVLEQAFGLVLRIREMPDGRVLIADPLGQALVLADLAAGTADTIGRVGQGPAEYRQPDAVYPFPGDSTLLVDLGNARLTVLGPDGSFGPTMPIAQGEPSGPGLGGMMIVMPQDVDGRGRIYFQPPGFGPGAALPDSGVVMRMDRSTGTFDTVATVKLQQLKRSTSGGGGNQSVRISAVPYSPRDGWAVAPDGRVAVVRSNGYYVEWIHPDGRVVKGPQVPFRPVPIRRAEKREWVARQNNGIAMGISITNGVRQTSFRRGGSGLGRGSELDGYDWPDTKPAFNPTSPRVDLDGNLWVERYGPANSARNYDLFDANGVLQARVTLPAGRQLVGFGREGAEAGAGAGAGAVYLVFTDEFDLQYLERYRLEK